MEEMKLGIVEAHFADIIWENEPITSGELVRLSLEKLSWKKSTTYTVLKKLCDRGIFKNENSVVTSVISKDEFFARQSERFVEEAYSGSLPAFIAAFAARKKLTKDEITEIRKMIDSYEG